MYVFVLPIDSKTTGLIGLNGFANKSYTFRNGSRKHNNKVALLDPFKFKYANY